MVSDDTKTETMPASTEPVAKRAKLTEANLENYISEIEAAEEKINKLEDEQSVAICKLEQEYVAKKNPIFEERQKVIENIDKFWMTAFQNHPQLGCLVADSDLEAFEYLTAIKVDSTLRDEEIEDNGHKFMKSLNYAITFTFKENPFFENESLTKSFYQVMDEVVSDCDTIHWKENKNLITICQEINDKEDAKMMEKLGKEKKEGEEEEEVDMTGASVDSFFAWFEDHEDAANDETGDLIKEDLYIHALTYYSTPPESDDGEGEVDLEGESEE